MKAEFRWLVFSLNGRVLCQYSIKGTFPGEWREMVRLLAYENGVDAHQIEVNLK